MAEVKLTSEEYEKILLFQSRLNYLSVDYGNVAIRLFRELFNWNLTGYSKWSPSRNVSSLKTNGLKESFLREAHEMLLKDEVFRIYSSNINSNRWTGIFFSQDIEDLDPSGSELLMFLHNNNIYYFVTMLIATDPNEQFVLYKTEDEGPFTESEKIILQYLHGLLSSCSEEHRQLSRVKNASLVTGRHFDREGIGYVIIDTKRNAIESNETLFRMLPREAGLSEISSIVRYIIEALEQETGRKFEDLPANCSAIVSGYLIALEEIQIVTADNERETFYMLTSRPNYYRDMEIDPELSHRYSLTEREAQVAELIIKGMPNKLIADNLHLSLSTVKIHNSNIYRKLQVHNRMGVVDKLSRKN